MTKLIITAMTLLMATASQAQDYTLSGSIQGLADGTTLQLVPMSHDNDKPIAEATVSGGKFTITGTITTAEPRCVNVKVKDAYGSITMMVDRNDNATLTATATQTVAQDGAPLYRFSDVSVTGSPLTDTLNIYKAKREGLDRLYAETHDPFQPLMQKIGAARQAKNQAALDSLAKTDEYQRMNAEEKRFFDTVEKTLNGAINDNRATYWGPLLTLYYYTYLTAQQKDLYNSFSDVAKNSWYGQKVKDEIFPGGDEGAIAKDFQVKGDDGKVLTLDELCKGKTYVLIDFWASWCVPCRKEIPNVKAQYALYKDKGFTPVSISTDRSVEAWKKALAEEKLQWPNFRDVMGAADVYSVRAIPAMYLIDAKTKKIVASGDNARGTALAQKLAELYK